MKKREKKHRPKFITLEKADELIGQELHRLRLAERTKEKRPWLRADRYMKETVEWSTGISSNTLKRLEEGTQSLNIRDMAMLCDYYGIRPSVLVSVLDDYFMTEEMIDAAHSHREIVTLDLSDEPRKRKTFSDFEDEIGFDIEEEFCTDFEDEIGLDD